MADVKISKELQETVKAHPHIKEVHFTDNGHHFFNVHKIDSDKYGRTSVETVKVSTKDGLEVKTRNVPVEETKIVKSLSREEVLKAKVEGGDKADGAAEKLKAENEALKKKIAELESKK